MNFNKYFNYIINNKYIYFGIVIISIITLLIISIGQTARWDILDHISMSDHFDITNQLYPSQFDKFLSGSSVYFPGVSIITIFFKFFIIDKYVQISLQLLACLIIIIYFFIILYIVNSFSNKIDHIFQFYFVFVYFFYFNIDWLYYACEFKPDLISYCCGSIGIILSGIDKNEKKKPIIFTLGILITGIGIIFKQQYLFFLFGLLFYSFFDKRLYTRIFIYSSVIISLIIIFVLHSSDNIWFWTVKVLSDDGFLSIKKWVSDHKTIALKFLILTVIYFILIGYKTFEISSIKVNKLNIWIFIMFFVFLGAVASSFKVGGNSGNTSFGLVVLTPLFILLFRTLNLKNIFLATFAIIIFIFPRLIEKNIENYSNSFKFKSAVEKNIISKKNTILIGSDMYFAARNLRNYNFIANYWMYAIKNNSDIYNQLHLSLESHSYDYLIIENWPQNLETLNNYKNYQILFQNKIGIIAKFKK
jgi:hypothetical protein